MHSKITLYADRYFKPIRVQYQNCHLIFDGYKKASILEVLQNYLTLPLIQIFTKQKQFLDL